MALTLFLRTLWRRFRLSLSSNKLLLPGLWDPARRENSHSEPLDEWRNTILLQPRDSALANGAVVSRVEHLKEGPDTPRQHEFLRVHVLHEATGEQTILIVDREFRNRPDEDRRAYEPESPGSGKRSSLDSRLTMSPIAESYAEDTRGTGKRDVPEERGRSLAIYLDAGYTVTCRSPFASTHCALDWVHRGVADIERRRGAGGKRLQSVVFPERSRPSVVRFALLLGAVSGFAPRYHIGEYQCQWFVRAVIDAMRVEFKGQCQAGIDVEDMGAWKGGRFRYVDPSHSVLGEYKRQMDAYTAAFKEMQQQRNGQSRDVDK